jgi:hypothetical protein
MLRTHSTADQGASVIDEETRAFLESGCALIVGTVDPDGAPHAGRGWGLSVLDGGAPARLRLLLDAEDGVSVANAAAGGAIAVTATSVTTLRSIQLKGRSSATEVATVDDEARAVRFIERFFADVHATDGVEWEVFDRMTPAGYVAAVLEAHEAFDQTPGPRAGARVGGVDGA